MDDQNSPRVVNWPRSTIETRPGKGPGYYGFGTAVYLPGYARAVALFAENVGDLACLCERLGATRINRDHFRPVVLLPAHRVAGDGSADDEETVEDRETSD